MNIYRIKKQEEENRERNQKREQKEPNSNQIKIY